MSDSGAGPIWGPPGKEPPASGQPMVPPVLPPTVPAAPAMAAPSMATGPAWPPASLPGAPQMSFESPAPPKRRRSKVAVTGAVAGVLALGVTGVFAVGQFSNGNTGGADSPEAVGMEMMNALEQEDVLGMVDLLLPGERDVFREPLIDIVSELSRLDILTDDASLADLSGLDIAMTDESVAVTPTNVDDISNIMMSATITASLNGDELPIGSFITDLAGDDFDPSDMDQPEVTDDFELPMTVVEEGGRWYLSIFYTAAETLRGEFGDPIPEVGLESSGGATPEGAIDVLLDSVEQLDLGKFIAAINPNEAAALQRYAPIFLDDISSLSDELDLDWQVTKSEYDVTGSGSRRFVKLTDLRIDGTFEGSVFFIELADGCVVVEADGERLDSCALTAEPGEAPTSVEDLFGDGFDIEELTTEFQTAFADYNAPGITVQEVDGEWYVSPIGSGFDQLLALLGALDRDELDALVETTTNFVADLTGEFDNVFNDMSSGGSVFGEDVFGEDVFADDVLPSPDSDPVFSEDDFDDSDFEAEQAIVQECYSLDSSDDVIACLVAAVDAGDIADYYVGPELRFPECGVADVALGRTPLFDLTDEEYVESLQVASTCFAELIASGDISEFEVPSEYLRPECAEGRNPWNFEQDENGVFFDIWIECIYS